MKKTWLVRLSLLVFALVLVGVVAPAASRIAKLAYAESVTLPPGSIGANSVITDGVDTATALKYVGLAEANADFKKHALSTKPSAWTVFAENDDGFGQTVVVSANYAAPAGVTTAGTVVTILFDPTTLKVKDGFTQTQLKTDKGIKNVFERFDGTKKEIDAKATPPSIDHTFQQCKLEEGAFCAADRRMCLSACDGDTVCREWCTLEYIACRSASLVYCSSHRLWE